jgi:hypothetical protein
MESIYALGYLKNVTTATTAGIASARAAAENLTDARRTRADENNA